MHWFSAARQYHGRTSSMRTATTTATQMSTMRTTYRLMLPVAPCSGLYLPQPRYSVSAAVQYNRTFNAGVAPSHVQIKTDLFRLCTRKANSTIAQCYIAYEGIYAFHETNAVEMLKLLSYLTARMSALHVSENGPTVMGPACKPFRAFMQGEGEGRMQVNHVSAQTERDTLLLSREL